MKEVKRDKDDTQTHYDRISSLYDYLEGSFERKYQSQGVRMLNLKRNDNIIDIGCGTGEAIIQMSRDIGPSGMIHGLDISKGMLNQAYHKIKKHRLGNNVILILGDGTYLPFKNSTFDAIFMSFTLELFKSEEISQVLNEVFRVLKKNGKLLVVGLSRHKVNITVKLYETLHDLFPRLLDCRPIPISELIKDNNFKLVKVKEEHIYSLPIEIVLARK
ncbi:MAG: class I SAM-dependent methyltransferase [Thermoplasmatota archaeon]